MNPMLKMIQIAAEKAEWDKPLYIDWQAGDMDDNPFTEIRLAPTGKPGCVFVFGPKSTPFTNDWDIQMNDGSVLTVSAEAAMTAIEIWLNNHKN